MRLPQYNGKKGLAWLTIPSFIFAPALRYYDALVPTYPIGIMSFLFCFRRREPLTDLSVKRSQNSRISRSTPSKSAVRRLRFRVLGLIWSTEMVNRQREKESCAGNQNNCRAGREIEAVRNPEADHSEKDSEK